MFYTFALWCQKYSHPKLKDYTTESSDVLIRGRGESVTPPAWTILKEVGQKLFMLQEHHIHSGLCDNFLY